MEILTVWVVYIHFELIMRLKDMKNYVIIMIIAMWKCPPKIIKHHGEKSIKAPFTIYADLECLLIKEQSCQNNPNESYTERKTKHEPSGYSLSLISPFNSNENKPNVYRVRECIEKVCRDLKELATETINYEEKDMIPLTDNENKFYEEQKECHICQKEFYYDKNEKKKFKKTKKLEIIVIIQENLEEQLVAFAI